MKKAIRITALILVCLSITVIAAGCSVKGNSYVYDGVKVVKRGDMTAEEVKDLEEDLKNDSKNTTFTFEKDGTFRMSGSLFGFLDLSGKAGYWKQFGSKLYYHMTKNDFKEDEGVYIGDVKMGKVVKTVEDDDVTYEIIFKKK